MVAVLLSSFLGGVGVAVMAKLAREWWGGRNV